MFLTYVYYVHTQVPSIILFLTLMLGCMWYFLFFYFLTQIENSIAKRTQKKIQPS
jgi:hypothetical protein